MNGLTGSNRVVHQRFPAPSSQDAQKTVKAATWFTSLGKQAQDLGVPLLLESVGLPWYFGMRSSSQMGSSLQFPLCQYGGWLKSLDKSTTMMMVLLFSIDDTVEKDALPYAHAASARVIQCSARHNKLIFVPLVPGDCLYLPPFHSPVVIAQPSEDGSTDSKVGALLWIPHLAPPAFSRVLATKEKLETIGSIFDRHLATAKSTKNVHWKFMPEFKKLFMESVQTKLGFA